MTADAIVYQFIHSKQPANDYLSQCEQISSHLTDLKEAIDQLLFAIRAFIESGRKMLNRDLPLHNDIVALNVSQTEGIALLRQVANKIESYKGYEKYLKVLCKKENLSSILVLEKGIKH